MVGLVSVIGTFDRIRFDTVSSQVEEGFVHEKVIGELWRECSATTDADRGQRNWSRGAEPDGPRDSHRCFSCDRL